MTEFFADVILTILAIALVWFICSIFDHCGYNEHTNNKWWR